MTALISVEPSIFPAIAQYYEDQRTELGEIRDYLATHCTLSDATGWLLSSLQPKYDEARESMFDALEGIDEAIANLGIQVAGCEDDYISSEESMQAQIDELKARVTELEEAQTQGDTPPAAPPAAAPPAAGPPSGGPSGGGPSGGGPSGGGPSGGGSPVTAPAPPPMAETEPPVPLVPEIPEIPESETGDVATPPTINIDIDVDGDGNTVEVTIGDDDPFTAEIGDDNTVVIDPDSPSQLQTDELDIEEQARHAEFYERIWEERAAADPVGRTADELRLAWEAREPIEVPDSSLSTGIGYVGETADLRAPLRFEIFLPEATGAPVRLEGARS